MVSGMGWVKIGDRWVSSYFQYQPNGSSGRESWTVRVSPEDFAALNLPAGGEVSLQLPQHAGTAVRLRRSWPEFPFVWMEFAPQRDPAEVTVDAADVRAVARRSP